jgi:colicin import membrane protein
MAEYFRQNWQFLIGALLVHVLFAGIFGLTMVRFAREAPQPSLAINATVVDLSKLPKPPGRPKPPEVKQPEVDPEAQAAEQRRKDEEEAQKQKEQQEKEQQQEQERQAQAKREEEQKQQEREVQEKAQAEQKRVAEAQAQQAQKEKADAEAKAKAQAEAKAKAEADAKAKAEAERKRVAEIERKQKEEADKRKAAADAREKASREAELRQSLQEEEGRASAVNSGLLNQWVALIQQKVERNWNRPPSTHPGLECTVKVSQTPGGVVLSAQVTSCNCDAAVKQSIEAAVLRSSPLPPPSDPRLFERNLEIVFKPAD